MKTSNGIWHGLMSVAISAIPSAGIAAIQHTEGFSNTAVTVTRDTIDDNGEYSHVRLGGLYNTGNPGEPSLPVKYLTFSVPYDAYNISVSATGTGATTIALQSPVYPAQEPRIIGDTTAVEFTMPDSGIYSGTGVYPATLAEVVDEGFLEGDNHLVTVAVYPVRYDIGNNTLSVYSNVSLTLSYSSGAGAEPLAIKPLLRYSNAGRAEAVEMVKRTVANPAQVEGFLAPIAMRPYSADTIKGYEYCIITSRELAPAFRRLVALKRQKGYNAGIVCMEDILANPRFQNGDDVSGINDDAGKLRAYLTYAWQNHGTRFVLLGGKPPHVPIRYGYSSSNYEIDRYIPTDLYFSDFNGNWNRNGNNLFGEENDKVDYSPEIYIGRLLCKNKEEVNNYIDKLLIYELNPGNGDYSYLQRGFYAQSEEMKGYHEADTIANHASFFCPDYTIINESGTGYPTGADIVTEINRDNPAFISINAHGSPVGVTTQYYRWDSWNVTALDTCDEIAEYEIVKEQGNGLDCLTNRNYPSVQYSISCTTMPYDIYRDGNILYDIELNFGESFTLGKDYGGVAYLGNTRYGYVNLSVIIECNFLNCIREGNYNIGIAEAISKRTYYGFCYHRLRLTHNLLGDPEFEIWTNFPVKYTAAIIDINRIDNDISVSEYIMDSCKIIVCTPDCEIYQKITGENGWNHFPGVSPNSAVMIYHHNMIPYIAPLIVQNQTYTKSQYLFASTVQMGKYVNEFCEYGNVVFDPDVDFVVDASGDVYLGKGVIVNPGAVVTVKSAGTVTLDGIIVNSGGSLTIEAAETVINNSFEVQDGAEFEIKLLSD